MSDPQWTVSFGPGGREGIKFPPDPPFPNPVYLPSDDEVRECWAMAEVNPDGYLNDGLEVPDEAGKYAEFDRWLLRIKRQVWEEGFSSGAYRGQDLDDEYDAENPYWD